MAKYRKKPVVVETTQWFKNGDHPKDHSPIGKGPFSEQDLQRYYDYTCQPGKVVRFPSEELMFQIDPSSKVCDKCGKRWEYHGECGTLEGLHIVCPGDWIITGVKGEYYPCKPDIFELTYEPEDSTEEPLSDGDIFLKHIESHLGEDQFPICKICGDDIQAIVSGYIGPKKSE